MFQAHGFDRSVPADQKHSVLELRFERDDHLPARMNLDFDSCCRGEQSAAGSSARDIPEDGRNQAAGLFYEWLSRSALILGSHRLALLR
jgi:hypothetical protein